MSIVKYVWERITADGVPLARSSHEVSLIGDCLYVFGGENIARTPIDSSFYKLTLSADNLHWDKINASGTPPSPRIAHAQCVVGNTICYFIFKKGTILIVTMASISEQCKTSE